MRFDLLLLKVTPKSRFVQSHCCHLATVPLLFFALRPLPFLPEDFTVLRTISLALVLMAVAGVASAGEEGSDKCWHFLWVTYCPPIAHPSPVKSPEIDPASAMAVPPRFAGGLGLLPRRPTIKTKETN